MSLNFGRGQLSIPGPSIIPDRVLNAMHRPSPNIYEGALVDLTSSLFPDLRAVAKTEKDVAIYIANGHGAWEAALRNTLNDGDKVLVLVTGRFAANWGGMAQSHGVDVEFLDFGMEADVDLDQLETHLKDGDPNRYRAVLTVQTDTATAVINDVEGIRKTLDASSFDGLYMVDCIACLGCDPFYMDDWGVDVMVAACQKGLMTPAGIAFVYFNEKAADARKLCNPGEYWDWYPRTRPEMYYQQFNGTAPTHHLYGLREALNILVHEEGIDNAWARHKSIAAAVWAAIDAWGAEGSLRHNITDPSKRSNAVSTVNTSGDEAGRLRAWSEHKGGVTLGIGLGFGVPGEAEWDRHFRIGHMGHLNLPMIMGALASIDTALKAEKIPHGNGALEAATTALAAHYA